MSTLRPPYHWWCVTMPRVTFCRCTLPTKPRICIKDEQMKLHMAHCLRAPNEDGSKKSSLRTGLNITFFRSFEPDAGQKLLIGDQLAPHMSYKAIKQTSENFITDLPTNNTHFLRPLDVAFFNSVKVKWRKILGNWCAETRSAGVFPNEVFLILLSQSKNVGHNC